MYPLWSSDRFDLESYLAFIGYDGGRAPDLATLRALHRAHVLSVPFENLEVILGRGVSLDLAAIQDKVLPGRRGGYCYEHVTLFAAALERLGFGVTGLVGRARMGQDRLTPATHALLRVETAETPETGQVWISDVGFGASPLTPIELADGAEAGAGDWRYRLERGPVAPGTEGWILYEWRSSGWFDRHGFGLTPQFPVDYTVGNHYIATHPRSPFAQRPFLQRVFDDRLHVLDGRTLTTALPGQDASRQETRELEAGEVPAALTDLFGVELQRADAEALVSRLTG
ncbi:N-hydroxyarylamine O-acetyltransferase [Haloactinospora alba]|uniref:N-hydroxyarylamine O-acetyltransferase n=1 Tax=Haloactinospora alba TaxID=405555 RepID=A0A543NKK4_9ACTN|nr:arylamine N-acetyltransferase [Haloactinospora alba]TQN32344.1 N-hydroxyarylamine O-acetyltransferase [Haloactinospora alba]